MPYKPTPAAPAGLPFRGTVTGWTRDGAGVVEIAGHRVSVPGALPGEDIRAEELARSRHRPQAWARLVEVVRPDVAAREALACQSVLRPEGRCGGCPLLPRTDADAVTTKLAWLAEDLGPLAVEIQGLRRVGPALGYRNRNIYVVEPIRGGVDLGSFSPGTHDVATMLPCVAVLPAIDAVARRLASLLGGVPVAALPRYLILRANRAGGVLVEAVCEPSASRAPTWLPQVAALAGVEGAGWSVAPAQGNAIRGSAIRGWTGARSLPERMGGVTLPVATDGFAQLNPWVAGAMYEQAAAWLANAGLLWDLYCGMGALGLNVAARGSLRRLRGAETNAASVALAQAHAAAQLPGLDAQFAVGTAHESPRPDWPDPDAVVLNPPRRGLDAGVVERISSTSARTLVYMSCGPAALARDAAHLATFGWRLAELLAYDMLPGTAHVELLGRWERS